MIFADKLILLRKKAGWSQEELADQMNVTRQSVSKWEGAQSVPDLEKMIRLSKLFGVSTDYLLKDEIEEAEHISLSDDAPTLRRVSMDEANTFLSVKLRTAKTIAYAAFLCILSPIALLILGAISESMAGVLNEDIAGGIGMIALIIFVAIAAAMFISSSSKSAPFAYLEKEKFETEYGDNHLRARLRLSLFAPRGIRRAASPSVAPSVRDRARAKASRTCPYSSSCS